MSIIKNEIFEKKAISLKRPLIKTIRKPVRMVDFTENRSCFQRIAVKDKGEINYPIVLNFQDKVILDFGDHLVGYLHFSLDYFGDIKIADAPSRLKFTFGEFPYEMTAKPEEYKGGLGSAWLQNEERSYVFLPVNSSLERRYAFRYLMIERTDTTCFPLKISDIFAECVSAVDMDSVPGFSSGDSLLDRIYEISLKTLKECEQEVFEDGPKRDRRLWIGDLRLQAMTDYCTFRNIDLIKRCIYLFAAYRAEHKMVAPCVFPDSPPHVDEWTFADYSLFFISCLYDYYKSTNDFSLLEELFDVALEQAKEVGSCFNKKNGELMLNPFIDWCKGLDKSVAFTGVYIYTLRQLKELCTVLNKDFSEIDNDIKEASDLLIKYYNRDKKLFIPESGQLSYHSQIWGVLSGVLDTEENIKILENLNSLNTEFTMRTTYMRHFYIEALYNNGLYSKALEFIKDYWGQIVKAGFDCCPEVFNPDNEFESPYCAPEINSACHAWSCTPAYWIPVLMKKTEETK